LVVGLALVVVIAVVFFRRDPHPEPAAGAAAAVNPAPPPPSGRPVKARPTSGGRRHVVRDGETLRSLARRYYSDEARADAIFQANRGELAAPDPVLPGTVLVIPDLPE
jgi:nucleoid-associated protein YgaU